MSQPSLWPLATLPDACDQRTDHHRPTLMTASMRICKSRTINGSFSDPAAIRDPCAPLKRPRGNHQRYTGRPRREKGRKHESLRIQPSLGQKRNFQTTPPPDARASPSPDQRTQGSHAISPANASVRVGSIFLIFLCTPSALPCTINQGSREARSLGSSARSSLRASLTGVRRARGNGLVLPPAAPCPACLPLCPFRGLRREGSFLLFFAVMPPSRAPGGLPRERTCSSDRQR